MLFLYMQVLTVPPEETFHRDYLVSLFLSKVFSLILRMVEDLVLKDYVKNAISTFLGKKITVFLLK